MAAQKSFIFSKEDFIKVSKLSTSNFSVEELTRVNDELKALSDYFKYFSETGVPYSLKSQGLEDLARGVIFLPIITFIATFIIPPFIGLYIIWFILKYWEDVIKASWGWFVMLYEYGTHLIEGKLGCKWYISMVTGWGCHSPKFSEYYDEWLKKYVIVPSYHEKVKYIDKYSTTKNKWYNIPKLKYFDTPKNEIETELQYAKKTAIDRTGETFLKKLASFHTSLFEKPKDQLYKWLLYDKRTVENKPKSIPSRIFQYISWILFVCMVIMLLYFLFTKSTYNTILNAPKSVINSVIK